MNTAETPDPTSRLSKVYKYLWKYPDSTTLPDDCMPFDSQVQYIFEQVKHLRDGTDFKEITVEELQDIMNEEQPGWRENKEGLPDWFLEKHGIQRPIMR